MSESLEQQRSFLRLVPTWQRPMVEFDDTREFRLRRWSTASSTMSLSSLASLSSDYGENGFLVLTPIISLDPATVEDEE